MRIELTIGDGDSSRDVAIRAPAGTEYAAVADELARAAGLTPGTQLWSGERLLTGTSTLGVNGLRTGALVSTSRQPPDGSTTSVLCLHVVGGPVAGRVLPLERGGLTIGRAPECDLVLGDDRASRRHACLDIDAVSLTLHDLGSTNGVTVDGVAVAAGGTAVHPGQLIRVGDTLLAISGPGDVPATATAASDTVLVNRAPRRRHPAPAGSITMPDPPGSTRPRRVQWVTALLPAAAGGAIAWFTGTPAFLLFALLSPVMMLSSSLGDRVHWRRSRRRVGADYQRRRSEADRAVSAGLVAEAVTRRGEAPDPASVWRTATATGIRIWERRRTDGDHLRLRLGIADLPSALQIKSQSMSASAGVVRAVPLCVDLRRGPLGIAGPPEVVDGLARWLIGQLAVLHSPADVDIALLLSAEAAAGWRWARWLPHLASRVAVGRDESSGLITVLAESVQQRRPSGHRGAGGWHGNWLVVVVDRTSGLADVPGLAALLGDTDLGVTAVCLDVDRQALPAYCATVACIGGDTGTALALSPAPDADPTDIVFDRVDIGWADQVARALAPLADAGRDDASVLPPSCRLLDLLGLADPSQLLPEELVRRWAASSGRADTVLGVGPDGPLHVDLVLDGPHALVAGTTGSGKSELLRSLVVGLAARHPPEQLTLLLIDYKGGAAFADCARLPHTVGLVTDLDPHLAQRALSSLRAELRRRETVFAAAEADDLVAYRARGGDDVARLVIVIDEFATLTEELPDFVRGIVAVAQRGRSLGVHLVLATQRPGRAVTPDIRANTDLRIALRVTDPVESGEIIDTADAAGIDRRHPGRAYARTRSTPLCFQTAQVSGGDPAPSRPVVEQLGEWRRPVPVPHTDVVDSGPDDLARVVDALATAARHTRRPAARAPWLDPLPTALARAALPAATVRTHVVIGVLDEPAEQRQPLLTLDLAAGRATLLVGGPGSGCTEALAAMALAAAAEFGPAELELYVIDTGGHLAAAVAGLPHLATELGPDHIDLAATLLARLQMLVRTSGTGGGIDAGTKARPAPRRLLIVDGWGAVLAAHPDADAVQLAESLAALLRAGPGLCIVVAGDRSLLAPRTAGAFATRLLLRLDDRADYGLAGVAARHVPSVSSPGRGVRAADGLEFQLAHAGDTPDVSARQDAASRVAARWTGTRPSDTAVRLRPLPRLVRLHELPRGPTLMTVGLAGDAAQPLTFDPFAGSRRILVAGPPRSGRTTLLRVLLAEAHRLGLATIVAATARSPVRAESHLAASRVIDPVDPVEAVGDPPRRRTLLLVDDSEAFTDCPAGEQLTAWVRAGDADLAVVVAGRSDDLAVTYRGIAAEVRRHHCGVLLRPGPVDGELLGVRLGRRTAIDPPGRGVVIGDPSWSSLFECGTPVPVQVARP